MLRSLGVLVLGVLAGAASAEPSLTCDPGRIDPRSYALTTRAQARNLLEPRHSWWDSFDLGKYEDDLAGLNEVSTRLAERARQIDPSNLMAHGILARQYVVLGEPEQAEPSWRRALDGGGAVVWSATLYDVDARTYFFVAFDRAALRVYRMDTLAGGPVKRGFYGIPDFPASSNDRFYEAMGGCLDPARKPEAVVPWSQLPALISRTCDHGTTASALRAGSMQPPIAS